jgi:hypothetical protein
MNAVYDALITFMTSNGWTVADTVTTRDKVLTSSGTDGKLNMVYRLTGNAEAGNSWKNPAAYQKVVPQIIARGYHNWNAGTDTGTNEYGILDMMVTGPVVNSGQLWYYNRINTTVPLTDGTTPLLSPFNSKGTSTISVAVPHMFDGRRRVYAADQANTGLSYIGDLASPAGNYLSWATNAGNLPMAQGMVWVWDATTNKEYIYYFQNTATLASQWWRYDIDSATNQQMAATTWAASAPNGSELLWDGGDYIYAFKGAATTDFSRYSISGNSWSARTASPALPSANTVSIARGKRAIYVPNSVTGIGEDVIYLRIDSTTTIHRYNVTANTWSGSITAPTTMAQGVMLLWDNVRYMYVWYPINTVSSQLWRSDLTTAPGTFTNLGTVASAALNTHSAFMTNTPTSSLRCSNTLGTKYWFVGDADAVTAVVRVGDNRLSAKYYWFRLGKYTTNYKSAIMTLTGSATAGVRPTITVDSTTGYNTGEKVTIFDASTGTSEQVVIYEVTSATQFKANNLVYSYTSGSKAGSDVVQHILTGDSGFGGTALTGAGFKPDYLRPWYYVAPDPDTGFRNSTYTGRGAYMPLDFRISNPFMTAAGTYPTAGTTPFANCEFLGRLTSVYALPSASYPAPQAEDTVVINGQNYIYFPQSETAWLATPNNMGIVVGPF